MIITVRNLCPSLVRSDSIITTMPVFLQWDIIQGTVTTFFGPTALYGLLHSSIDELTRRHGWQQAMFCRDASPLHPTVVYDISPQAAATAYREEPESLSLRPIRLLTES